MVYKSFYNPWSDLSVLVAVADVPRGRIGEVAPGSDAVEDLILELCLRLPQSPNLVMELGELRVQRPLLWSQLHLGTDKSINSAAV